MRCGLLSNYFDLLLLLLLWLEQITLWLLCIQSRLRQTRDQGERRHIRDDIKSLRRELRQRESSAVSDIIRRATVVLSTLTTAADDGPLSALDQHKFDVVVIDECSQVACCL